MWFKIFFTGLGLFILNFNSVSQNCNCASQLDFAIQKIEHNYAGFADKINLSTQLKYAEYTKLFRTKAANEKNMDSCLKLVKEWTKFFRDGHLQVRKMNNPLMPAKPASSISSLFYFKNINAQTNLIRISSFNHIYKKTIDSIIASNYTAIISTQYLLLDLRGNGGGSDVSYEKLLPFIYTNPIIVVGSEKLSTSDNIAKYEAIVKDKDYPESTKAHASSIIEKLKAAPGKFISGDNDTLVLKQSQPFPTLVGVLADKKCGSTTEQFLLAARQSKKTVLFGENSMGVLDYANMHFLNFPCSEWQLGYATSRSMRLPAMPVDNIGIAPDIRLGSDEGDWINYATSYLNQMPSLALNSLSLDDTARLNLHNLAKEIAGKSNGTFNTVRNIIWWTNKNFHWNYTDYKRRTVKQIICQQGGNCNEQAMVVRALLTELHVKTRRMSEINIQPENPRRQKDAEQKIAELGNRASVFGFRHNDHVWTEFYDEEGKEWIPADPTLGLIGLENWIQSRIGFEPRVNHAVVSSADMLVPIAVFALNPDGTIAENRSEYYLIKSFNQVYKNQLIKLPSWIQWEQSIGFINTKAREAFEAKDNLHKYSENIRQLKDVYESMKSEYTKQQE